MRALLQLARRIPARQRRHSRTAANGNSMLLSRSTGLQVVRSVAAGFSGSTLRQGRATSSAVVDATDVLEAERSVLVQWEDGRTSHYDFTWLRVNCPSCLHESGQRTVFPGDVEADLKPTEVGE